MPLCESDSLILLLAIDLVLNDCCEAQCTLVSITLHVCYYENCVGCKSTPSIIVILPIALQFECCMWHKLMCTLLLVHSYLHNESTAKSTSGSQYSR